MGPDGRKVSLCISASSKFPIVTVLALRPLSTNWHHNIRNKGSKSLASRNHPAAQLECKTRQVTGWKAGQAGLDAQVPP